MSSLPRPRSDSAILDWLETFAARIELGPAQPWPDRVRLTTTDGAGPYIAPSLRRAAIAAMDDQEARDCGAERSIRIPEESPRALRRGVATQARLRLHG